MTFSQYKNVKGVFMECVMLSYCLIYHKIISIGMGPSEAIWEWFVLGTHSFFMLIEFIFHTVAGNLMLNELVVFQLTFVFISRVSVGFWIAGRTCWLVFVWLLLGRTFKSRIIKFLVLIIKLFVFTCNFVNSSFIIL